MLFLLFLHKLGMQFSSLVRERERLPGFELRRRFREMRG